MGLGLAYPMEQVDTILEKRAGYIGLSGDRYYLHALNSNNQYKAYLAVKNKSDILVNQQQLGKMWRNACRFKKSYNHLAKNINLRSNVDESRLFWIGR